MRYEPLFHLPSIAVFLSSGQGEALLLNYRWELLMIVDYQHLSDSILRKLLKRSWTSLVGFHCWHQTTSQSGKRNVMASWLWDQLTGQYRTLTMLVGIDDVTCLRFLEERSISQGLLACDQAGSGAMHSSKTAWSTLLRPLVRCSHVLFSVLAIYSHGIIFSHPPLSACFGAWWVFPAQCCQWSFSLWIIYPIGWMGGWWERLSRSWTRRMGYGRPWTTRPNRGLR